MNVRHLIQEFRLGTQTNHNQPGALNLSGWQDEDWMALADYCQPLQIDAGESLITSGNADRSLYLVAEGRLEVALVTSQTLSVSIMSLVNVGSVVGEQAFFDASPRSANVWALQTSRLLKLELQAFQRYAQTFPLRAYGIIFALGRIVTQRLRLTTAKLHT